MYYVSASSHGNLSFCLLITLVVLLIELMKCDTLFCVHCDYLSCYYKHTEYVYTVKINNLAFAEHRSERIFS